MPKNLRHCLTLIALSLALAGCMGRPGPVGNPAVPQPADGKIKVVNSCYKGSLSGKFEQSTGKAKLVEGAQGAKLKVSFFGPFYGDYWVLDRSEKTADNRYEWSIVGEPSGRYLWMLTREANPDKELANFLEQRVRNLGYDWTLVRLTQQPKN